MMLLVGDRGQTASDVSPLCMVRTQARRVLSGYGSRAARPTREEVEAPLPEDEEWNSKERWARNALIEYWRAHDTEQVRGGVCQA